jgi:hypothetical protein
MVSFTLRPHYTRRILIPTEYDAGISRSWSGRFGEAIKHLLLQGFEPWLFCRQASSVGAMIALTQTPITVNSITTPCLYVKVRFLRQFTNLD